MALDETLVKGALAAKERCRDLEIELSSAKENFTEAVRRLHGSGASLREIATALDLSHQRVHQLVVGTDAGVWARLGWGSLQVAPRSTSFCSFCGASQVDAQKLVAGPGVWICEQCIASARRVMIDSTPTEDDLERFALAAPGDRNVRCNFCGRKLGRVEHIVTGGSPFRGICDRCLKLCDEVLEQRTATKVAEVPEIAAGTVQVRAIAREPGLRTKIAVSSTEPGIDSLLAELGSEHVDIVHWEAEPEKFVAAVLGPATVVSVAIDSDTRTAHVRVPKDQLSLAIGRHGQNARLAAKLTGWRVDIKSVENGVAQDET